MSLREKGNRLVLVFQVANVRPNSVQAGSCQVGSCGFCGGEVGVSCCLEKFINFLIVSN